MFLEFEDFRGISGFADFSIGVGSIFRSGSPGLPKLEAGKVYVNSSPGTIAAAFITDLADTKKIAARFEITVNTNSFPLSFGFSNEIFNSSIPASSLIAPFQVSIVSATGGYKARIQHSSLTSSSGTSTNQSILSESEVFTFDMGATMVFDYSITIGDDGIASLSLVKDGSVIATGSVNVDRINSGRQVKSITRLNIATSATNIWLSNVIIYIPDAETPHPLTGLLDIVRRNSVNAALGAAFASDTTFITYANDTFEDIALTGTVPADAEILAAKGAFRYGVTGNAPSYPELAVAFADGRQFTGTPPGGRVNVGTLPLIMSVRASAPMTPADINGAKLQARSKIPPA